MARSLNGNLRGHAARPTIDDQMEAISTPRDRARKAVARLKKADPLWEEWYDKAITDEDMPFPEIERIVNERIKELEYKRTMPDWVTASPADDPEQIAEAVDLAFGQQDLGESPTELRSLYGYG